MQQIDQKAGQTSRNAGKIVGSRNESAKSRNKREGGYAGKSRWVDFIVPHRARHYRGGTGKWRVNSLRDWSRA